MTVRLTLGASGLRALAADLSSTELLPQLRREMRAIQAPILADVRSAARAIPTHGRKHTGARRAMARAAKSTVKVSARSVRMEIIVNPALMPAGQEALPRAFERETFTHPTYGRKPQQTQRGHPWARVTVERHVPDARAAIVRAADAYARQITSRRTPI